MSFDHALTLFSVLIAFIGLILVLLQRRKDISQRELESQIKIYDINRELISLGFSHPQLFAILQDTKNADPIWERRYLQMWLNQLSLIHFYLKRSVQDLELRQSLENSLTEFMSLKNMQRHWQNNAVFYPVSFQNLVNGIIKKNEPLMAVQENQDARTCRAIFSNVARGIRTKFSPSGAGRAEVSEGARTNPCTNTSPLSARMAAGHEPRLQSFDRLPFSPIILVIFIVMLFLLFLIFEPELRILVHWRRRGRLCLTSRAVASI